MRFFFNKRPNGKATTEGVAEPVAGDATEISETELAAVAALTIHRYLAEIASSENMVITMQKYMKTYSPWNSKFYGLRQQPLRMPRQVK